MSLKQGWKIHESTNLAVDILADVSEGEVGKIIAAVAPSTEPTAEAAGAGDMPAGVFSRDMDYSEGETRTELVRGPSIVVVATAAAITDLDVPVMVAAAGTCTPVTADQDIILGKPLNLQATVGGDVKIDLTLMGSYYALT